MLGTPHNFTATTSTKNEHIYSRLICINYEAEAKGNFQSSFTENYAIIAFKYLLPRPSLSLGGIANHDHMLNKG